MPQAEFSIKTAGTGPDYKVVLEGALCIQHIKAIHEQLVPVLNNCIGVIVTFENITKIDFAVLQLIASFYKTCIMQKINISFDLQSLSADIASIIEKGGFADLLNRNTGKP